MDKTPDIKLNEICRICLLKIDNSINIMETNQYNSNIISMLSAIGNFEVVLNDFLPKYLCKECENKLELSYNFQKTVQKSNEYLMKCFNEKFENLTDGRILQTAVEIMVPKEELDDQPSLIHKNDLCDVRGDEFVDNNIDEYRGDVSGDIDPLEIRSELRTTSSIGGTATSTNNEIVLPSKSLEIYENTYRKFICWQNENNMDLLFTEDVILTYLNELSKKFKSSTLWSHYSMLKSTISLKHNIDIANYPKVRRYLKIQNEGHIPKKSLILEREHILEFMKKAPDDKFLLTKVILLFGISGSLRRDELYKLETNDIQDLDSVVVVFVRDPKTLERTRKFTLTTYLELYRKYVNLRPKNLSERKFFIAYHGGKCTRQAVGINKIGRAPSEIAKFLNLPEPEKYTGHSFRRSSTFIF